MPSRLKTHRAHAVIALLAIVFLAGAAAGGGTAAPRAGAAGTGTEATGVAFGGDGALTRFVLEVTGPADFNVFPVAGPSRIVIDLEGLAFAFGPDEAATPPAGALVSDWRYGEIAPGRARVVLDARGPVLPRAAFYLPPVGGAPGRVVVELAPASADAFASAVARADAAAPRARAPAPRRPAGGDRPLVVIDPGHGGIDPGAVGPDGLYEKDLVLAFSRILRDRLLAGGAVAVLMTREDDRFLSLGQRVEIAREAGARLFLSIHADAAPQAYVRGATVYTLSERPSDAEAAFMAARENMSDTLAGLPEEAARDEVSDILFDLTRRETRAFSRHFADLLVDGLGEATRLINNPHRSARFRVLTAHDVPSALVEIGYLSNDEDAALMVRPEWQGRTAAAIARAVERFLADRGDDRAALGGG